MDNISSLASRMLVVDEAPGRNTLRSRRNLGGLCVGSSCFLLAVDSLCTFGIQTGRIFREQVEPYHVLARNIESRRKRRTTRKTLLNLDSCNNSTSPSIFCFLFCEKWGIWLTPIKRSTCISLPFSDAACLDMANEEHNKHVNRPIMWSTMEKDLNRKDLLTNEICIYSEAMCIIFLCGAGVEETAT